LIQIKRRAKTSHSICDRKTASHLIADLKQGNTGRDGRMNGPTGKPRPADVMADVRSQMFDLHY